MPLLPPVTSATLPSSFFDMGCPFFLIDDVCPGLALTRLAKPSADAERFADDPARAVGREEHDGRHDVLYLSDPAKGDRLRTAYGTRARPRRTRGRTSLTVRSPVELCTD